MITLEQFIRAIDFKISSGEEYTWTCYGPDARWLESYNENCSMSAIFDGKTRVVYEAHAVDHHDNTAYRVLNAEYQQKMFDESVKNNVDHRQVYDDVQYVDVDDTTFLQKIRDILNRDVKDVTLGDYIERIKKEEEKKTQ